MGDGLEKGPLHPLRPKCFNEKTPAPTMEDTAVAPIATPSTKDVDEERREPLFHVVLLDDDEHTYDYVVEMLQKLFALPTDIAFQHAVEVDTTGRTIVITCERPQAEFARDQIQAYGADPRMPNSKGSMSAVLLPVSDTAIG
jgi:ATP-dependent Clp protease adaptor protein ClpS